MNRKAITYIVVWVVVSFIAVLGTTQVFASLFNSNSGQVLSQAIAWISLVLTGTGIILNQTNTGRDQDGDENENDDNGKADTTDSSGPSVEPASRAYSFSATASTDEPREPLNRTGLRRSNDDILEEAGAKLRDQIDIYDDGTIELDGDGLDLYRKLML